MGESLLQSNLKGRARMTEKYIDIRTSRISEILDELDDNFDSLSDIVVIGFQDNEVVFVGETGILTEQKRSLSKIVFSRWLPD